MGRPTKRVALENALCGWGSLRVYWRAINQKERAAKARQRAYVKTHDKKRPKCRCAAYPWPHRPGGGLCRWPNPPVECYKRTDWAHRPYRRRYAGILRQIARNNGLHPIRDRATIEAIMPVVLALAKQLKRQTPRAKCRNMEIVEAGQGRTTVRGVWTSAGPTM